MFPFAAGGVAMDGGVLYGTVPGSRSPVVVDPFDPGLDNANAVVVATSGAGKSYFTKLLALRCLAAGVDFLVIDPEGEYRALCAAVGGQHVRLAPSSGQRLNPFDLPPSAEGGTPDAGAAGERDPLAEQVAAVLGLLEIMLAEPGRPLGAQERAALDRATYGAYAGAGITADPATHGRPAPLLRDLAAALEASGSATALGLATRLRRYVDGSLAGLFAGSTNVALDRRLIVFDVQGLEPEQRPVAIHQIAAFVWRQVRRARRPRLLVVDEAWCVLQYPEGGAFLAGMARRARKYYLGLVTITQQAPDLLGAVHGRAVAGNAATKLLLKQDPTTVDAVEAAFALSPDERRLLLGAGKGEGLLLVGGRRLHLQVAASPAEHRLATTAPQEAAGTEEEPRPVAVHPAPSDRRRKAVRNGDGPTYSPRGARAWPRP
jgi:type IV secretory pathway VirB4 component